MIIVYKCVTSFKNTSVFEWVSFSFYSTQCDFETENGALSSMLVLFFFFVCVCEILKVFFTPVLLTDFLSDPDKIQ